ncbi:MAG: DUF6089 family protein [Saprospiraceae bacterium]
MRFTLLILTSLVFPLSAAAQANNAWEFGAGIGLSAYDGELQNLGKNARTLAINPSFSAHLRRHINNNFAARIGLLYAGLSGSDRNFKEPLWRQTRNFSFSGSIIELAIRTEFFPFGFYKGGKSTNNISPRRGTPFVSVGIGGGYFRPKNDWNEANGNGGTSSTLVQFDKTNAKNASVIIPIGIGARFRLGNKLSLGIEGALHLTPSDYLDGVSVAGNPDRNDRFVSTQVTASYAFGKTSKPVRQRNPKPKIEEPVILDPDRDRDGVADDKDQCPDLAGLPNLDGCPDTDSDGIADKDDHCPEKKGPSSLNGCPDRDEDGIADKDDNCPDEKGVPAYRGCPAVDRDRDGVADAEDLCPDMSGQLKWKGCPDSDNDGIPDNKDGCPGIAGPALLRGCPDTDGDGIPDKEDECPTLAGSTAKKGCPDALPATLGVPYKAIYFSSTLDAWQVTSLLTLEEVIAIMSADPTIYARIEGHTDNTGKEPANDLLAEKRAQKCRNHLVSKGIAAERLHYIGLGSKKPVVPNDSRENRQLNRRVEIHFYKM